MNEAEVGTRYSGPTSAYLAISNPQERREPGKTEQPDAIRRPHHYHTPLYVLLLKTLQ
jgi:hypothetical protein